MKRFVDTNVLLYFVSGDPGEAAKQTRAAEILEDEALCLSVQVLQEFYVQATRRNRPDRLVHDEAAELIACWLRYPVLPQSVDLMVEALAASKRWQLSYWDAAIVEAARSSGCRELLSEDLSHGQDYGGVRVVNPFATEA